jgi:hypothetical protein
MYGTYQMVNLTFDFTSNSTANVPFNHYPDIHELDMWDNISIHGKDFALFALCKPRAKGHTLQPSPGQPLQRFYISVTKYICYAKEIIIDHSTTVIEHF